MALGTSALHATGLCLISLPSSARFNATSLSERFGSHAVLLESFAARFCNDGGCWSPSTPSQNKLFSDFVAECSSVPRTRISDFFFSFITVTVAYYGWYFWNWLLIFIKFVTYHNYASNWTLTLSPMIWVDFNVWNYVIKVLTFACLIRKFLLLLIKEQSDFKPLKFFVSEILKRKRWRDWFYKKGSKSLEFMVEN